LSFFFVLFLSAHVFITLLKEDKQGKRSDDLLQVEVAAHQRMNTFEWMLL